MLVKDFLLDNKYLRTFESDESFHYYDLFYEFVDPNVQMDTYRIIVQDLYNCSPIIGDEKKVSLEDVIWTLYNYSTIPPLTDLEIEIRNKLIGHLGIENLPPRTNFLFLGWKNHNSGTRCDGVFLVRKDKNGR